MSLAASHLPELNRQYSEKDEPIASGLGRLRRVLELLILSIKSIDAALSVHELLLSGEERMALGAYVYTDLRDG